MSKTKDVTTTSKSTNSIPDWLTSAAQSVAGSVSGAPAYQPYGGELAPGLSANQTTAINYMPGLLGQGAGIAAQGVAGANAASNFRAPQLTAAGVSSDVNGLLNPYTQNVVNATNNEISRQQTLQQQRNDSAAAAAHAFNGDRAGVVQAMNDRDFNTLKANTDAGLYKSGYDTALSGALTMGQGNQNAAIQGAGIQGYGAGVLGSLGSTVQNANMSDIAGLLGTGGVAQTTQAAQDTAANNKAIQDYIARLQGLQGAAGALGALPHDTTTNSSQTTPVTSNWGMGLLGAGLGIAGLAMPGGGSLGGSLISGLLH